MRESYGENEKRNGAHRLGKHRVLHSVKISFRPFLAIIIIIIIRRERERGREGLIFVEVAS